MKIGILQGRLSPPVENFYQEFPLDWEKEFENISNLKLHSMEWLVTPNCFNSNPLIVNPKSLYGLPITSVCIDTLVDSKICDSNFISENLDPVCEALKKTKIKTLTIPILDESDLSDCHKRKAFCYIIKAYGEKYKDIRFSFESEIQPEKLNEIVSLCNNFYVTYDTGNITSSGIDHEKYIQFFGSSIINVHLKDRTYKRETVSPLTGDTDFHLIFKNLKKINYKGPFILQTAREEQGKELETIKRHKDLFESLYERYF